MSNYDDYVTFSSLGGSEIHAMFGNFKFASLQMVRYAANREKGLVFTLGSPSARATARGKRQVSGALVFAVIDRDGLVKAMARQTGQQVFLSHDELANYANQELKAIPENLNERALTALLGGGTLGVSRVVGGDGYTPFVTKSIFDPANFGKPSTPFIADQLLPFDITLIGTPEYGSVHARRMIIYGVEITTEASGTSIDDLIIEKQMGFIAKSINEWTPLAELSGATGTNNQNVSSWGNQANESAANLQGSGNIRFNGGGDTNRRPVAGSNSSRGGTTRGN